MTENQRPLSQSEILLFMRLHCHLPDQNCGKIAGGKCFYREDGVPINILDRQIKDLRNNEEWSKKEVEVKEASFAGKKLFIKKIISEIVKRQIYFYPCTKCGNDAQSFMPERAIDQHCRPCRGLAVDPNQSSLFESSSRKEERIRN